MNTMMILTLALMLCFGLAVIHVLMVSRLFERHPTYCMLFLFALMFVMAATVKIISPVQ